jgi:hypothetical protein
MRLSVYLLRDKGERIPLERVRATAPHTGYVRVTREPGGRVGPWSRMAMLMSEEAGTEVLLQLHQVQLQQWDAPGRCSGRHRGALEPKAQRQLPAELVHRLSERGGASCSAARARGAGADLAARTCFGGGSSVRAVGFAARRLNMGHFEEAGDVPHPGV